MIADFIRNREVADYDPEIQKGIYLHRHIDHYTDNHPQVLQGVRRLQARHRKYAPVVIDILYDYLLANNWDRYSGRSLRAFTTEVYEILEKYRKIMPAELQQRLPQMIAGDWLMGYGTRAGLLFTLEKMDQRTRFPSIFAAALEDLELHYDTFEQEFNNFFPDVISSVAAHCKC